MKAYFIDTNILIYAQGAESKYKNSCQIIARSIALNEIYGVANTEVLQEIIYRYAHLDKKSIGIKMVENALLIMHEILPVERADILLSLRLLEKYPGINPRDAIHAATALRGGFKYILSVDRHFDRIKGLQRIDPRNI